MVKNRICYAFVLFAAFLFFCCFNGYLSFFSLAVVLVLPVFSLFVSLPGIFCTRLTFACGSASLRKGQDTTLSLTAKTTLPIPGGRARVRLTVHNRLTGETQTEKFFFTAGPVPLTISHRLTSNTCGELRCTLSKGRVCDYLGLFSFPLRLPKNSVQTVVFYPTVYQPRLSMTTAVLPDGEVERYSATRPGSDPSELFALREYRDGDKLSQIHWKLSQKTDQLLVREYSLPISDRALFLWAPNGTGAQTDLLLDAFSTLSSFLLSNEVFHRLGLAQEGKPFGLRELSQQADLMPVLNELVKITPQPEKQRSFFPGDWVNTIPTGISHVIYLTSQVEEDVISALRAKLPGVRITAMLAVEAQTNSLLLPPGVEPLLLAPGSLPDVLDGFVL